MFLLWSVAKQELKEKYEQFQLPTDGFKTNYTLLIMNKKQIYVSAALGVIFLLITIILGITVIEPNPWQQDMFRIVLALAGAAFAAIIPGFIELKYSNLITAGGALAVFFIIFKMEPARLQDFSNVNKQFKGNISLNDGSYFSDAKVIITATNQTIKTNDLGNFNTDVDYDQLADQFEIKLIQEKFDTILVVDKKLAKKGKLNIKLSAHCVKCKVYDQNNILINQLNNCNANSEYIKGFKNGILKRFSEQEGMRADCTISKI